MEFGKLSNIERVDFSLPEIDPYTCRTLGGKPSSSFKGHIGLPAWGHKEWKGNFYPPKAQPQDFLKHYSDQLKCIELNTTHYRIPDDKTVQKWIESTASDFVFCTKFPQIISHAANYQLVLPETRLFCEAIRKLGSRLGASFLQLPPTLGRADLSDLAKLITNLPTDLSFAAEFRNMNLFRDGRLLESLAAFLTKHNISTVITDVAGRRDVSHMTLTTKKVLIRFIGNNLHPTDFSRVDVWTKRLSELKSMGLEELYFFCHEPDDIKGPELAKYVITQFNKFLGTNLQSLVSWHLPEANMTQQLNFFNE